MSLEERWANRRTTGDPHQSPPPPPPSPSSVYDELEPTLASAMRLLSDYEDAIFASCRHALMPASGTQHDEARHMVEAHQLHGDVRRLRVQVLEAMTVGRTN